MKYLEELAIGDCFEYKDSYYILSSDFKSNGQKMCLSLINGFANWFNGEIIVNIADIFTLDKNSNIIAIKERKKDDDISKNKDIS